MRKILPLAAIALAVGFAAGYALAPARETKTEPATKAVAPKRAIPDAGTDASVAALRHRIALLEKALAEARAAAPTGAVERIAAEKPPERDGARRPHGPDGFRRHLEELKKKNPKRYAEITERIARMRANRRARAAARLEFLASVDTSKMSAAARETHDTLQDLIAKREELEEQMHDESISGEERASVFNAMREVQDEMRRLNAEERSALLGETVSRLGISGNRATDAIETIQGVIEATQDFGGGPPPPGPPSGGTR